MGILLPFYVRLTTPTCAQSRLDTCLDKGRFGQIYSENLQTDERMPKRQPLGITPSNALQHLWYCYQRVVVMAKHKRLLEKRLHSLGPEREKAAMTDVRTGFPQRHITYTSFLYASLSTLVEGYRNPKAAVEKDPTIEKLLAEDSGEHVKQLRELRHSVFHWSRVDDPRFFALFKDKRTREWCAELALAFQRYLKDRMT